MTGPDDAATPQESDQIGPEPDDNIPGETVAEDPDKPTGSFIDRFEGRRDEDID